MKIIVTAVLATLVAAAPALAENAPAFAAECAGGVNQGGYNIDGDGKGHLWVNGHRVTLEEVGTEMWEGAYHGVVFTMDWGESAFEVIYTGRHGANGICKIVAM